MLGAAAVSAQSVAGKATRDALFLTSLDFTALPVMLIATSACTIVVLWAHARGSRTVAPAVLMPAVLVASGVLFVVEWLVRAAAPPAVAVLVYLHVSTSGSLLASAFWLIVSEQHDPRTAKRRLGPIGGAGTLGGLLGALFAERVAAAAGAPAMLICLAGAQFFTAWLFRRVALSGPSGAVERVMAASVQPAPRSALRIVAEAPHLQTLAVLVLLGTTSAALVDYLFKARAVETFGPGDNLLRFFALYYAATALVTFVLQIASSRAMLERFGLAMTASTPSIALLAGSIAGLVAPGFGSLLVARGSEAIFRGSWFRAGYELFYTPIAIAEKRAAKSVIDVGADRLGDAFGGGLIRATLVLAPAAQSSMILALAMIASAGAIVSASRLNRWYSQTLETSLVSKTRGLAHTQGADDSLRKLLVGIRQRAQTGLRLVGTHVPVGGTHAATPGEGAQGAAGPDAELQDAVVLRSGDPERVRHILTRDRGLGGSLIHHVIPLLAVDSLADHAIFALCRAAEEHLGELGDALLDPRRDPAVRVRLARVFAVCVSQRAADILLHALDDSRFDVRFQAGRSLSAIRDKNPRVSIDRQRIYDAVLDHVNGSGAVPARDDERLAHVFTLLSLAMPREPLRMAYRGLRSEDRRLRGTALEYLDGVLPAPIRQRLWPLLVQPSMSRSEPAARGAAGSP